MPKVPSPYEIYKSLPKKNCGECQVPTCIAFAVKIIRGDAELDECPYLTDSQRLAIEELIARPVRSVTIGVKREVTIGGQRVLHRYEQRFYNTTAVAVDIDDRSSTDAIRERIEGINRFRIERMGSSIGIDLIAVRGASGDGQRFRRVVSSVNDHSELPQVLCSYDPRVIEEGLETVKGERPLIHAATMDTLDRFIDVAKRHDCPLVLNSGELNELRAMARRAAEKDVDIVLDPSTHSTLGVATSLQSLISIRRAAIEHGYSEFGFPTLGNPSVAYLEIRDREEALWREALLASMLMTRYADILILHSLDVCEILPLFTWRQDFYRDPRTPAKVESGIYSLGIPDDQSPVIFTTNNALTYYTVASDIESSKIDCYLLVVDADGLDVLSAIGARSLTAEKVAETIREAEIKEKVKHRKLIIPGKAARLRGEIEDATKWEVLVGPPNSFEIPRFLQENWLRKAG